MPLRLTRWPDVLLVHGPVEALLIFNEQHGMKVRPEAKRGDEDLTSEDVVLAEAVVAPNAGVIGRSPRRTLFRRRYRLTILAIRHQGRLLR